MPNQVVKVHTIEEWLKLTPEVKLLLLRNIRLKERLFKWLENRPRNPDLIRAPDGKTYIPCLSCEKTGWEYQRERKPGIHPSQLPHPCHLKIYNEMVGAPGTRNIDPRLHLIFDMGHAIHKMLQTYGELGAWGPYYKKEVELSPETNEFAHRYMIEASVDADHILVIDDIPNHPVTYELGIVHEYKSSNSNNFDKLTGPKPEHQKQASIYSEGLDRPVVVYLYLNKNDQNIAEFAVPYERSQWATIEGKARSLVDSYHAETPPAADPGFHCQECQFSLTCQPYIEYSSLRRRR